MSHKKSQVWSFFDKIDGEPTKVKCNQCGKVISHGGKGKKANTTSLTNHIKHKHVKLMPQLTTDIHKRNGSTCSEYLSSSSQPSTSAASAPKQLKLQECISSASQWAIDDLRSREIHFCIGEMIALDNKPMSVVERVGFTRLMKKVKPKYKLPSRKYFSETIIPQIYNETKNEISKGLVSASAISITTDMWTNSNNVQSFLSYTAHWLDKLYTVKHAVLQMKHFPKQHTAENILKALTEIPTLWEINPSKIHAIVRDNGRNIVKAIADSSFSPVPCLIHTLQLAINDSLTSEKCITEMITHSRRIVTHFHHSGSAQEKLAKIQNEFSLPQHQLIQDVTTHWNSTYYMLS